ncbi:hypothetical protein [Pseudonocardia spirodelae]|uniref:Glucose-6-phosphate isomerase n=1 Tax=Pseudonocardia spirodelae TaxID=3133431 RepID=A0ABU8TC91_9PSEU
MAGTGGDGADLGSAASGGPSAPAPVPVRVRLAGEPFAGAARRIAADLAGETVASRLAEGDPSVWGPRAAGAPPRTGWAGLAARSRPLAGQVAALRERLAVGGAHRVLLVGTPDVVAAARLLAADDPAVRLTALDSADPVQVAEALSGELGETALVVADASGSDPVVCAVARVVTAGLAEEVGAATVTARTVHLTEPGSPLDTPGDPGPVVVTLDADVPGRFGALGPAGLVPAGLAGADVAALLADAVAAERELAADSADNPALLLAGALAAARGSLLALRDGDRSPARTAWLAPLLTAAGLTAVVSAPGEPTGAPAPTSGDAAPPAVVDVHADGTGPAPGPGHGAVRLDAGPGAAVVLWQAAAALAARVRGVDPFPPAPPAVTGTDTPGTEPAFVDGGVAVHAGDWLPAGTRTVGGALDALAALADPADGGHLTVSAWLDPESDASVAVLRGPLTDRLGLPVAFGWAPGCRSGDTGTPDAGVHCHLTGSGTGEDAVPHGPGLDSLHAAQARAVVEDQLRRGRPVLRLHLTDRLAGLVTLARAVTSAP